MQRLMFEQRNVLIYFNNREGGKNIFCIGVGASAISKKEKNAQNSCQHRDAPT